MVSRIFAFRFSLCPLLKKDEVNNLSPADSLAESHFIALSIDYFIERWL